MLNGDLLTAEIRGNSMKFVKTFVVSLVLLSLVSHPCLATANKRLFNRADKMSRPSAYNPRILQVENASECINNEGTCTQIDMNTPANTCPSTVRSSNRGSSDSHLHADADDDEYGDLDEDQDFDLHQD